MKSNRIARCWLSFLAITLIVAACGGSDGDAGPTDPGGPGGGGNGTGPMTATIDGVAFVALAATFISQYSASTNTYTIIGANAGTTSATARAVLITLQGVTGPGTYTLNSSLPFRYANTVRDGLAWETNGPGGSGTVVVTTATPTRFVGTFSFVAVPAPSNPSTGTTVTVTNGAFDVTIVP